MRIGTLRCAVGAFCAVVGALMLVAPHRFGSPIYAALQPNLHTWGVVFVMSGAGLIAVAAMRPRRSVTLASHVLAGGMLLVLSTGFIRAGAWTGTTNYAVLGLGTMLAGLLPSVRARRPSSNTRDLLALAVGLGAALTGLAILTWPGEFGASVYDQIRTYLPWYGLAFLIGGILLVSTQTLPHVPRMAIWSAHLLLAAILFAIAIPFALAGVGTAIVYYGCFGLALALLPWLGRHVWRIDPASLRVRLALTLAAIAAAPVIVAVALETDQEERLSTAEALAFQQSLALVIAQDFADYVGLHRSAIVALAAQPGLLEMTP